MRAQDIHLPAARLMIAEMIAMAIEEYRELFRVGAILPGYKSNPDAFWKESGYENVPNQKGVVRRIRVTKGWLKVPYDTYSSRAEVEDLICFFRPGGQMDEWLLWANIDLTPTVIRKQIERLENQNNHSH